MDYTKPAFAFIGVMIVGFLLVAYNRIAPPEGGEYGLILTGHQLSSYAREVCLKATQGKTGGPLYAPVEQLGEGNRPVELHWKPTQETPHSITCRYEQGKGVTEITIDGTSIGPVSIDINQDSSTHAPGSLVEKHWGHW
ncbi:MAG: hypothetical protein PHE55_15035 [Methylococcaceae bacterium]|nr:hypothetical protein [Methylococcaceae bacterium]